MNLLIQMIVGVGVLVGCASVDGAEIQQIRVSSNQSVSVTTFGSGGVIVNVSGKNIENTTVTHASGPEQVETRPLPTYSAIEVDAPVIGTYTVSSGTPMIEITAPASILPLLTTTVEDQRLKVSLKGSVALNQGIKIKATGPNVSTLSIQGASELSVQGISGPRLLISLSGSGRTHIKGQVDDLKVELAGSGQVEAQELRAKQVTANLAGSGSISAFASQGAAVKLAGSGRVVISGYPKQRKITNQGSGSVELSP